MTKCICDKYQLTYADMLLLAPSKKRKPGSIDCPICNQTIQATKQSKAIFVAVLVILFVSLGFLSAFWISAEKRLWSIVLVGAGLVAHYIVIWPKLVELEYTELVGK